MVEAEHMVLQRHPFVHEHVVLNLDFIAYSNIATSGDIPTDLAILADMYSFENGDAYQILALAPISTPSATKADSWAK